MEEQLRVLGALDEARVLRELDDDALVTVELKKKNKKPLTSQKIYEIVFGWLPQPLCGMDMSYVLPLLVGLLKGLREDLDIRGPFCFGLRVGGDVETHLHRTNG